jgi:glycerol-1-phosphate dehydrogenase [NAD(P)+]
MDFTGSLFPTIYGRNLIEELKYFVPRPYLVVTMEDLWHLFKHHFDENLSGAYFVNTLEFDQLMADFNELPEYRSVIGLGGGQAIDVAKFFVWNNLVPLFTVPTVMTTNAAFGQRSAVRIDSAVKYVGWAVPEAVYIDYDVIQNAPKNLNRSGVGDIFCYHTGVYDWKYAHDRGKTEAKWPYDQYLVDQSTEVLNQVLLKLDDIRDCTELGIRTLMNAHRWGGGAFHNAGWNARHIEGFDHFLFYALEFMTKKSFIHGQPVCLGVYIGSELQNNHPDRMLEAIKKVGVDIRPEAMGLSWEEVAEALRQLKWYVNHAGLWWGIAHDVDIHEELIEKVRLKIYQTFGEWDQE